MAVTPKNIQPNSNVQYDELAQILASQAFNQGQNDENALFASAEQQVKGLLKQILTDSNNDIELALAKSEAALIRLMILASKITTIIADRYNKAPLLTKEEIREFDALKAQLVASGLYSKEDATKQFKVLQTSFKENLRPIFEECLLELKPAAKAAAKPRPKL